MGEHVVVQVAGRTIAFLSLTWGLNQPGVVPERELFVVPFGHAGDVDLTLATETIRAEPGVGSCAVQDDSEPRTAAVLYSLGNAATTMGTLPCQVGLLATVSLGDAGVTGLGWDPLVSHESVPEVRPLDEADADEAAELERLSAHVGEGWRRSGP